MKEVETHCVCWQKVENLRSLLLLRGEAWGAEVGHAAPEMGRDGMKGSGLLLRARRILGCERAWAGAHFRTAADV